MRADGSPESPSTGTESVPCPLCGGTESEVLYPECSDHWMHVPGSFPVVRCTGCSLVRTDPRPAPEELGRFYPPGYDPIGPRGPENPLGGSALTRLGRKIAGLPFRLRWGPSPLTRMKPGKVIDVGGGDGSRLAYLRDLGWDITLMEPRAEVAASSAAALGLPDDRVVVAYAEQAELPQGSFDLVVMDHVVEHLLQPDEVLSAIAGWLKPGGALFITCPNFGSVERRPFGQYWPGLDVPRHLFHFTPETLGALAAEAGLEMTEIRPQFGVLTNLGMRWFYDAKRPSGTAGDLLKLPVRAVGFSAELLLIACQAFGFMPMMEVVLRKPA